jgi:xanthine dehydrogenase small subunit
VAPSASETEPSGIVSTNPTLHRIATTGTQWHAPRTLTDLAQLRLNKPEARLVAGATDVGLWVTKQFRELGELIFLGDVAELRQIEASDTVLRFGAAVSLEDAWTALVARWPSLGEMARRFAGPPVRHSGTLVGNLANGSPIGDSPPVLMALGASLLLRRGAERRKVALERFYTGYMRNELQPGEFVEAVEVSLETQGQHAEGWQVQAHKISKRFDCDISALSAGFALRLNAGRVAEIRLAWGGMAATVQRSAAAEAAARGQPWTEATLRAAQAALTRDFTPLSDLRASADYRREVAAALLERFWLSTRLDKPMRQSELRVWTNPGSTLAAAREEPQP